MIHRNYFSLQIAGRIQIFNCVRELVNCFMVPSRTQHRRSNSRVWYQSTQYNLSSWSCVSWERGRVRGK